MEKHISIAAYGNPDASSGYTPIVWFNNPNISVRQDDYTGFSDNSYFFVIKSESRKSIYTLVKNHVRSKGAGRNGVSLKIAISIPAGYAFSDGITPYDVLLALKDAFIQRCMKAVDTGSDIYEYSTSRIDKTVLDDIAQQFPLIETTAPCYPMVGKLIGYCTMSSEHIQEFFRTPQRAAFTGFNEVIIAETAGNTPYTALHIAPTGREEATGSPATRDSVHSHRQSHANNDRIWILLAVALLCAAMFAAGYFIGKKNVSAAQVCEDDEYDNADVEQAEKKHSSPKDNTLPSMSDNVASTQTTGEKYNKNDKDDSVDKHDMNGMDNEENNEEEENEENNKENVSPLHT